MRKLIAVSTAAMVANTALAGGVYDTSGRFSGSYLCEADAAGGVAYDENLHQWIATKFRTDRKRFTLVVTQQSLGEASFLDKNETAMIYQISVGSFGEKSQSCSPIGGFEPIGSGGMGGVVYSTGFSECRVLVTEFKFNFEKLRYMRVYTFGFTDGEDNAENTPSVEIGRCAKIS